VAGVAASESGWQRDTVNFAKTGSFNAGSVPLYHQAAISLTQTVPALSMPENKKHHETKHWHCYGFLPGFTPREMLERKRERQAHYYRLYGPQYYGPAWPGFYRGRWNGGGFGPCWTQTPIGPMWNCGR
jgi:hypothetical protein